MLGEDFFMIFTLQAFALNPENSALNLRNNVVTFEDMT